MWASLPTAKLIGGGAPWEMMRFWGATGGAAAALLDLQLYDAALSYLAVRKMALGLAC